MTGTATSVRKVELISPPITTVASSEPTRPLVLLNASGNKARNGGESSHQDRPKAGATASMMASNTDNPWERKLVHEDIALSRW